MPKTTPTKPFQKYSSVIVSDFLQTVMVVDDLAHFEDPVSEPMLSRVEKKTMSIGIPVSTSKIKTVAKSGVPLTIPLSADRHRLNAKVLIDTFADMGIVCAVVQPKNHEKTKLVPRILGLAQKSDIIVLDWVLSGEDVVDAEGKQTSDLIAQIAESSTTEDHKLRLIAVYTGNANLDTVLGGIARQLETRSLTFEIDEEEFEINLGSVRIVIFAKKYAAIPSASPFHQRKVAENKIPGRLVEEFTRLTFGLVSNVALQSLATIRNNTHELLAKFHSGLDAPFLTHRLLLPHPADASEHLTDLIGAEITALLSGKRVGEYSSQISIGGQSYNALERWLKELGDQHADWHVDWNNLVYAGRARKRTIVKIIVNLLTQNADPRTRIQTNLIRKRLSKTDREKVNVLLSTLHTLRITERFVEDNTDGEELDKEFAFLTAISSFYKDQPTLRFGTILKEVTETGTVKYWLCILPSCDCVRISGKRKFPFLRLKLISPDDSQKFDIVVKEGRFAKLAVSYRAYDTELIEFRADTSKSVRAEARDDRFVFESVPQKKVVKNQTIDESRTFAWLGELKFAHAQRVANKYAAAISRVGLDESEWLRRWSDTSEN